MIRVARKADFVGYDFHVREGDIGLIEINTDAGEALLNTVMVLGIA